MNDADLLTKREAAKYLNTSVYHLNCLIAAEHIRVLPTKKIQLSDLKFFQAINAKKIETVRAEVLRAYDIGLSMNLVESVATTALRNIDPLLADKQTARQFMYQTIYNNRRKIHEDDYATEKGDKGLLLL